MSKNVGLLVLVVIMCVACGGGSGGGGGVTPPTDAGPGPSPRTTNHPLAVMLETIQQGTVVRDVYTADLFRLRPTVPGGVFLRWGRQYGDIVEIEIATTYPVALDKSFNAEIAVNIGTFEYMQAATGSRFFRPDCATAGYQPNAVWEVQGINLGFYRFYGTVCESFIGSPQSRNSDGTYSAGILRWRGVSPGQIALAELIFLPYKGS